MTESKPTVAIVGGTGALGTGIAARLSAAGYPVVIGSRTREKAEEAAKSLASGGGSVKAATNAEAAAAATVVILTVPFANHAAIIDDIKPHVGGKLVVDTTVPLVPPRVSRVQLPPEGSAAIAAQQRFGETTRVVAAFHNVAAHKLQQPGLAVDCDVLVCGDAEADRIMVIALAKAMGLRGLHAGSLANSAAAEAMTSVLIGINRTYKIEGAGIRITGIAQA